MVKNLLNSYGVNNKIPTSPFVDYVVYPKSIATSTLMPAQYVSQSIQPTWVLNNSQAVGEPEYVLENQLQWAITFPVESTGTQTAIYEGVPVIALDCPRCVQITFSAATTNTMVMTINGWDEYGVPMSESSTTSSTAAGTTTYVGYKAFKLVKSVYFSTLPWASAGYTVLVQGGNFIGLPYFVNSAQTVSLISWQGVPQSQALAFEGNSWRTANPVFTTPDARGMVDLTAVSPLPNGATQLQVNYYAYGFDEVVDKQLSNVMSQPTGTMTYQYNANNSVGSSVEIAGIQNNTAGVPKLTTLVNQDRFGAQFPGDQDFITYYGTL